MSNILRGADSRDIEHPSSPITPRMLPPRDTTVPAAEAELTSLPGSYDDISLGRAFDWGSRLSRIELTHRLPSEYALCADVIRLPGSSQIDFIQHVTDLEHSDNTVLDVSLSQAQDSDGRRLLVCLWTGPDLPSEDAVNTSGGAVEKPVGFTERYTIQRQAGRLSTRFHMIGTKDSDDEYLDLI